MQKLEILRKKIDLLDNDILKLFSKRFEIVADI
jgi:chorismate mutase